MTTTKKTRKEYSRLIKEKDKDNNTSASLLSTDKSSDDVDEHIWKIRQALNTVVNQIEDIEGTKEEEKESDEDVN